MAVEGVVLKVTAGTFLREKQPLNISLISVVADKFKAGTVCKDVQFRNKNLTVVAFEKLKSGMFFKEEQPLNILVILVIPEVLKRGTDCKEMQF